MEQERALQPTDSTWLDTPEDSMLGRMPVSRVTGQLERLDREIIDEARELGFDLIGWSRRRDFSGIYMYVAHFVDEDGIELRVMAPRVARSETLWELIAESHEGRTFVVPAPRPYGLVQSEPEDDGLVVLARRTPLSGGYHYLRRAIDHHLSAVEGQLRRVDSPAESLERLKRLERRGSSTLARLQRLGYVGGVWLGAGAGAGVAVLAVVLLLLL